MTGSEVAVDSALAFGADGVVPGLGSVDPAGYVRLFGASSAEAWAEQERLIRLFDIVDVADRSRMGASSAALGGFKAALYLLGVIECPITASPASPSTRRRSPRSARSWSRPDYTDESKWEVGW